MSKKGTRSFVSHHRRVNKPFSSRKKPQEKAFEKNELRWGSD